MALERAPEPGTTAAEADRLARPVFDAGRQILLIGAGLAALIVITVIAVLVAGSRTASFPEDSPERALQGYLEAFESGDYETAYGFFSAEAQGEMSAEEFEDQVEFYGHEVSPSTERRIRVERVTETDGGVRLHLVVEEFYGDGLGSSDYSFERDVRMTREGGEWKIDEPMFGLDPHSFHEFEEVPPAPAPAP